ARTGPGRRLRHRRRIARRRRRPARVPGLRGRGMNFDAILQNLIFGLFIGSNYGVAAAGLSLVFGVLRVLNVAHGELLMLGGYTSFWLFNQFGVDPFVSVVISAVVLFVIGLALHRGLFVFVERLEEEDRIKTSLLVSF